MADVNAACPRWYAPFNSWHSLRRSIFSTLLAWKHIALKCDLRDDRAVMERMAYHGTKPVQYEDGLAVARRIRASRYLGKFFLFFQTSQLSRRVCVIFTQNAALNTTGA